MEAPPPFENDHYSPPPSEPEPNPETPPRKWYRFTLWKMVVTFVLLGVIFAYLRYTHWGYVLSENITRVGRSFGLVEQRDPNKIYVSAVRPLGNDDWEWSIKIPPSEIYIVCYSVADIPVSGKIEEVVVRSGEVHREHDYLLHFYVETLSENSQVGLGKAVQKNSGILPQQFYGTSWSAVGDLDWMNGYADRIAIESGDGEHVFNVGEKIVLLRQWPVDSTPRDGPGAVHKEGIMIWIEPAPVGGPWDKYRTPSTPTSN